MIAWIRARLKFQRSSEPAPVPFLLDVKIANLRASVRRGGQGSDLAAAELRGITETIMTLGAVQNRAIGWRGGR